jgi:predicted ATPase
MGVHTGSPGQYDGDYWGMDVHRAARIAAAAHGGQVVVSAATGELARDELPEEVSIRDLGGHRLKDIPEPERLYQLTVPGLQEEFPPPRTLGTATSLPAPSTPLLGREADLERLTTMFRGSDGRLTTITGPGGAGKTRLAVEVAGQLTTEFPDGVYFVPLAAVLTEQVMWTSIAEVLDLSARDRLTNHLASRTLLLVLDNLEQLDGADKVVSEILEAAPRVAVIATSRRALGLVAERQHPLTPLALPAEATLAAAESSGAVQLFVQRATAVQPSFALTSENVDDVVALCRRLDGLPLAIELCATRVRLLSAKALLGRIDQALDIASTSSVTPERQRTLRETIAWSYELLSPAHRSVFRRLSVFSGGADLEAVAVVACSPEQDAEPFDTIAELQDASLITISEGPDGGPRVSLLETIGQYAADQLREAGEVEAARAVYAAYYAELADRLQSMRESNHSTALELARYELDNFRAALEWSVPTEGTGDLAIGMRLCAVLGWVWVLGGYVAEGRRWHERVVARAGAVPSPDHAACLRGLSNLLLLQGEPVRAHELATRALEMSRALGDDAGLAFAMGLVGMAQRQLGELEAARDTLEQALDLHREVDDQGRLARVLGNLAGVQEELGELEQAEVLMKESLSILEEIGDAHEAAVQGQNLAYLLVLAERVDEASELARDLVGTVVSLGSPSLTMAFSNTTMNILLRQGDPVGAAHLFGAEEAMGERLEIPNPYLEEELQEALELIRGVMSRDEWEQHRQAGKRERVEDLLARFPGVTHQSS